MLLDYGLYWVINAARVNHGALYYHGNVQIHIDMQMLYLVVLFSNIMHY